MSNVLAAALRKGRPEVEALVAAAPDWTVASSIFEAMFRKMTSGQSAEWPKALIDTLHATYLKARDEDKHCANITVRTVNAMPAAKRNDTKKVMLEIANACRVFNAAHKVNFESEELPAGFDAVPMTHSKKKGVFTYATGVPSLYPKTSLTFDYWVPKVLEWTQDIRAQRVTEWRTGAATSIDSSTDFMAVCLEFLSDPARNVPIAKAEDREAVLTLLGEPFVWKKKSARREDIPSNSAALKAGLAKAAKDAGIRIPLESWSRLQHAPFIKSLLK